MDHENITNHYNEEEWPKCDIIIQKQSYQFDLRLSISCSNYIWFNLSKLIKNPIIQYAEDDEYIDFSIEAIKVFISYLENSATFVPTITNENVFTLNALSKKFMTKNLQIHIDKYITDNHIQLLPILLNKTSITADEEN